MKKTGFLLVLLLTVSVVFSVGIAEENMDIPTFRGVPLGTEYMDASFMLTGYDWKLSKTPLRDMTIRDMMGVDTDPLPDSAYGLAHKLYCEPAGDTYEGFPVVRMELVYCHPLNEDGRLHEDLPGSLLCMGSIEFAEQSTLEEQETIFIDFRDKFTASFGEETYIVDKNPTPLMDLHFSVWETDGVCIVLQTFHNHNKTSDSESDTYRVFLRFGWLEADQYLAEADRVQQENQ